MKTKPSFCSLFVSAILVSTNLYAESTNLSEKIGEVTIQAIPHDFSPKFSPSYTPEHYSPNEIKAISWMPKSILSGDGKHLLIRAANLRDGIFEEGRGPGAGVAAIPDFHALLSGDKFEKRENIAGDPLSPHDGLFVIQEITLSDDAQVIAVAQPGGGDHYFIKEGDSYKLEYFEKHYNDPTNKYVYGVTGSGFLYGGIGHPTSYQDGTELEKNNPPRIFLYDPKTKTMLRTVDAVKDWNRDDELNFTFSTSNQILSASYDGSVVATRVNPHSPTVANSFYIYYGDAWNKHKKIQLEGKPSVNRIFGDSRVSVSSDGKVVAFADKVYSGEDYNKTTNLPKQVDGKDNADKALIVVNAINEDGAILAGGIGNGISGDVAMFSGGIGTSEDLSTIDMRPIVWYGKGWSKTKDLGTLGGKDTDVGIVHSMSKDGLIMAGMSTNIDGKYVPTLWRFINENTIPALIAPEKMNGDIENIGKETLKILQNQRYGLLSLLKGCRVEGGEGHYCLEQRSSLWEQKQDRETKVGVSMAYALTDNFSVGGIIEHSVYNNMFDKNRHRNLGLGLFAEWRDKQANKEFYIRPAISFSYHNGSLARPISVGTEYAYGKIKQKGTALSLTVGEQYSLAENTKFDWFAGIRYLDLKQKGYQDSAEYFPIQYNAMGYKEGSVFAGLGLKKGLSEKLSWLSKAELEQVIYQRNPEFYAYNEHLGAVSFKQKLAKNSLSVSTGLEYKLNDTFRISLIPGITKASAQPLRWNVGLYLTGQF